ncbi:MAG: diphosphomevalonate decarboxylase [Anaerolineae bacterium]|nr:diphosphomevalonate decarboxylase [Anaerolineae bacterium]
MQTVTAIAHPSLAFVKYWGKVDHTLNIPANGSISVNLSGATTTTTVTFDAALNVDHITINGAPGEHLRVAGHLDRVRRMAGIDARAVVESRNDFPASAGIASSSSAFAALSLAASRAAGLNLDERALSILARSGSGSACRSIPDGFAEWLPGADHASSYARQIAPPDHWDLRVISVVVETGAKAISSSDGHRAAATSPLFQARLAALPHALETVRCAILARDFAAFGAAAEAEALSMHAVALTSRVEGCDWMTGICYWQPGTVRMLKAVEDWRRGGLPVYLTIDAGPNVHLLCEAQCQAALEAELDALLPEVGADAHYFVSKPAPGARVVGD